MKIIFILFFLVLAPFYGLAQNNPLSNDQLAEQIARYGKANFYQSLFLHLDKTVYTNNETLWFSAYLLNVGTSKSLHSVVTADLISEADNRVKISEKFYMREGLCFGSIALPDSIAPGNYYLQAHTNLIDRDGYPAAIFIQPITIKNLKPKSFDIKLLIVDSINASVLKVKMSVENLITTGKEQPVVSYSVGSNKSRSVVLNKAHECIINISKEELKRPNQNLLTVVTYKGETKFGILKLPEHQKSAFKVNFFPEGGYLIDGLRSKVGFEVINPSEETMAHRAIILQNGSPIDTITVNAYGMGSFELIPKKNVKYKFQLLTGINPPLFDIPDILEAGIVLRAVKAVVDDTLRLELYSNKPTIVKVLIHNFNEAYAAVDLSLKVGQNKLVVALPSLSKGIHTVSVIDEYARPIAERLFFAHYNGGAHASIETDKQTYHKREKVTLHIKVTDKTGKPASGIVSVACVQDNRLQHSKQKDIEDFFYLDEHLASLPVSPNGKRMDDKDYLENILLIKGWRKYRWQEMMKITDPDTLQNYSIIKNTGRVKYFGKSIKKPVELHILRGKEVSVIQTDSLGNFTVPDEDLVTAYKRKVLMSVNKKNKEGYSIEFSNPGLVIGEGAIPALPGENRAIGSAQHETELSTSESVVTLREVNIKAVKSSAIYGSKPFGSNECGDYVNGDGYLNWPGSANSRQNRPPVKGQRYIDGKRYTKPDGTLGEYSDVGGRSENGGEFTVAFIIYEGCDTDRDKLITSIDGIYTALEFYPLSNDQLESSEPQYLSTLFWMPGLIPDKNGELKCTFPTGDIKGNFKIVIQGVRNSDVISGISKITVN
jgi:hypothetical protein